MSGPSLPRALGLRGRLSRRAFIGGSAAAVCVACGADGAPVQGAEVTAGSLDEMLAAVADGGAVYVERALAWLVGVPADRLDAVVAAYDPVLHDGYRAGFAALSQRCPHLGCRVETCASSGWFECPCHAGHFGFVGEFREGLAERGMDQFAVVVRGNDVVIDTGTVVHGLPKGSDLIDTGDASGPHCFEFEG